MDGPESSFSIHATLSASIEFPAYLAMSQGGVPLIIRVIPRDANRPANEQFPIPSSFSGQEPLDLEVVLAAKDFAVDSEQPSRLLRVFPYGAGEPAAFKLTPQSTGVKRIVVDFYHRSRPAGSIAVRCEVLPQPDRRTQSSPPALADPLPLEVYDSEAPPPDLELRVILSQDQRQLSYRLSTSDREPGWRWQPAGSVTLSDELSAWSAQILGAEGDLGRSQPTKGGGDTLQRIDRLGLRLGEALLTPELREAFQASSARWSDSSTPRTLLITSDEALIPWELLKPSAQLELLGVQFRLSRWLAGRSMPGSLAISRAIMAATSPEQMRGSDEMARYFAVLAERLPLAAIGPLSTSSDLLGALQMDPVQLIHLEAEVELVSGNPERSSLILSDGALPLGRLAGATVAAIERGRPFIFLNVSSASDRGWTAADLAEWARLASAGASAFIGPLWDIKHHLAAQFAIHFYDQLWDGQPLGEAFYRARSFVRRQAPDDPIWLAYALWGDPSLRVQLATAGGTGDGRPPAKGTGNGWSSTSGTGDGLPFIPGTGGGSSPAAGTPPVLPSDARIWFVSANPDEGTNWEEDVFAPEKAAHWTKVHNAAGQRNIEMARAGDLVLAYSSAGRQRIVGLAEISDNPDQQSDGRWAVWIKPLASLEQGVSLKELRQATPDLAHIHNPTASFTPVTPGEWRTIRRLLVERNPAQQPLMPEPGEAAPALTWSPPRFSGDQTPEGQTTVQFALSNTGQVTLRRREPLTITATWRQPGQPPDKKPIGEQPWTVVLDSDLPPGQTLPVRSRSIDLPDSPGSYDVTWQAHADQWGSDMAPAKFTSPFDVQPPAQVQRYGLTVDSVDLTPAEAEPGAALRAAVRLLNQGDITWAEKDTFTVTLAWTDAAGQAVTEPFKSQEHRVGVPVAPGEPATLILDEISAPAQPGDYRLAVTVGRESWGVNAPGEAALIVRLPQPPPFAASLAFDTQIPAALWPGQRFEVSLQVTNTGAQVWGDQAVQMRPLLAGGVGDVRPVGALYFVKAAQPGETVTVRWPGEAPQVPGSYTISLQVAPVAALPQAAPGAALPRVEASFTVVDLADLSLAQLTGPIPDELPVEVKAQRLSELGRRLASGDVAAQQRSDLVHAELLPALFTGQSALGSAALESLTHLSNIDHALDNMVRQEVAGRGDALGALPRLISQPTLSAPARRWLADMLPGAVTETQDAGGQTILVLPAYTMAIQPDLQAPAHTVKVQIAPKQVILTYDNQDYVSKNAMTEPGWQDKVTRAEVDSPKTLGTELFKAIFNRQHIGGKGSTYDGYVEARKMASRRLRIELHLDPGLVAQKWEYLRNPFELVGDQPAPPLAVYADAPLVRFQANSEVATPAPAEPLRVLVAICNPTDLGQAVYPDGCKVPWYIQCLTRLDDAGLEKEMRAIEPALKRLQDELNLIEYKILGKAGDDAVTFQRLSQELKNGWHVLHIIGHGVVANGKFFLIMETPQHTSDPVDPGTFEAPQFRQNLRLVVLSTCQSAVREREAQNYLPSLAERLVRQGVRAVIAMQDVIRIDADQLFVQRFYEDLARTGRIDMAMAAARFDLYREQPEGWDWGMPVLFMSTGDGKLFEVPAKLAETAAEARTSLEDMKRRIAFLPDDPDLAARVLYNSILGRIQTATDDAQLLSRLAAVLAPGATRPAYKPPPLAQRQNRQVLKALQQPVQIDGAALERFVFATTKMKLSPRVYYQLAAALNGGKHVVLTGAPGTGKTTLAQAVCTFASRPEQRYATDYTLTTATSDWTTFDTVGGLVPAESGVLQFRPGAVLEALASGRWLIVDEINRAEIDKAFGELFTVLSGQAVQLPQTVDSQPVRMVPRPESTAWDAAANDESFDYWVHPSWRIIGTMNIYDKSYLFNMSFAFMRRFAFVDLDLPEPGEYEALLEEWLEKEAGLPGTGPTVSPGRADIQEALKKLLDQNSHLMRRRAIGPAIAQDIVRYLGQRKTAGDTHVLDLRRYLAEAFQLYVTPQLDSLDRPGIEKIYQDVDDLFKALETSEGTTENKATHRQTLLRIQQLYPHISHEEWDEFLRARK